MTLLLAVERPSWSSGATGGIGPTVRGTREASTQKLNCREHGDAGTDEQMYGEL